MSKPDLSVCLITYNQATYVREAIDSILAQKVAVDWQLVIADDFSTDGTREILLEYEKKFPQRVKLILQKKNVGPEQNWLELIAYPTSKYVLYTEGDDYFTDTTKLQRQVDFLETHADFSACFHPVKTIYEGVAKPDELFPTPGQRFHKNVLGLKELLKSNFAHTNSVMYRWRFTEEDVRDVFPKNIIPGDWFLHLLHAQTGKIGFINRAMSVYRRHPGGLWWDSQNNRKKFWETYGLGHLAMYSAAFELYGQNRGNSTLIFRHVRDALEGLVSTGNEALIAKTMRQFPGLTRQFIEAQHAEITKSRKELQEKNGEIARLRHTIEMQNNRARNLEQELADIKNSRAWKTVLKARRVQTGLKRAS